MSKLRGNPWAVLVILCLGFFMIQVDVTTVNIAIPSIMSGLGATLNQALWVLSSYTLTYAVFTVAFGSLGDRVGARNIFLTGMSVFVIASGWCGLAQEPSQLIAARVLQGLGAALLTPQTLAMITILFPAERRGTAFGVWGTVAGAATVMGPTLGGLIVISWGWRGIFFVNIPIGVVAFLTAVWIVPDVRPGRGYRIDPLGIALITTGLFALIFGLTEGQRYDWGTVWSFVTVPGILAAGVLMFVAFLALQRARRDTALLPPNLLRNRDFGLMSFVGCVVSLAIVGVFLPLTIYLQSVLELSALGTGLLLAPMPLVSMVLAPFCGRLTDKVDGKYILAGGLFVFAAGISVVARVAGIDTPPGPLLVALLIAGMGMGAVFAPLNTVAMAGVEAGSAGVASGLLNTSRRLGSVFGIATVGALLQSRLAASLHEQAMRYAGRLPPRARESFVEGFGRVANGGLRVEGGQQVPSLSPASSSGLDQLKRLGDLVFQHAYVDAMRFTLLLPIGLMMLAATLCLLSGNRHRSGKGRRLVREA